MQISICNRFAVGAESTRPLQRHLEHDLETMYVCMYIYKTGINDCPLPHSYPLAASTNHQPRPKVPGSVAITLATKIHRSNNKSSSSNKNGDVKFKAPVFKCLSTFLLLLLLLLKLLLLLPLLLLLLVLFTQVSAGFRANSDRYTTHTPAKEKHF